MCSPSRVRRSAVHVRNAEHALHRPGRQLHTVHHTSDGGTGAGPESPAHRLCRELVPSVGASLRAEENARGCFACQKASALKN